MYWEAVITLIVIATCLAYQFSHFFYSYILRCSLGHDRHNVTADAIISSGSGGGGGMGAPIANFTV